MSLLTRELTGKRLQLLKEAVPGLSIVAYLWRPGASPVVAAMNSGYEATARSLGVELRPIGVKGPEEFDM